MENKETTDDQYTGIYGSMKRRELDSEIEEIEFNIRALSGALNVHRAQLAGYTSQINDDRSDSDYTLDATAVNQLKGAIFATITMIKGLEKEVADLQEKRNELLMEQAKYIVQ